MLPKRTSSKKEKQLDSQQLELSKSVSTQQKLKKKRRTLLIGLSLTIGLSLIFSLFRLSSQISLNFHLRAPSFTFPSLKLSKSTKLDLKKSIFSILPDPDSWKIYVSTLHPPLYSWSHLSNPSDVDSSVAFLSSQSPSADSIVSSSLPQGTVIQDNLTLNQGYAFNFQVLISVPSQQIYIQIEGLDQNLIPSLVETIYWQTISKP